MPSFSEAFAQAKLLFLDLDGTLYLEGKLFPKAKEFVDFARNAGKQIVYLSNNSSKSTAQYLPRLKSLGLSSEESEIHNSLNATIWYLKQKGYKRLYVLGTPSVEQEFLKNDFQLTQTRVEAVVLTYDTTFHYQKMTAAHLHLHEGADFIATHLDLLCPAQGHYLPDIGTFLSAFESIGWKPSEILGKPNPLMIESILNQRNLMAEDCLLFGDRLYTDIAMGQKTGMQSILLLSGETKEEDLQASEHQPSFVFSSISEALANLNSP